MTALVFDAPKPKIIPVKGEAASYPVHRIFCVGRNYVAHAVEMGVEVDRDAPFYFTKSPAAIAENGATIPYPPATESCHYEIEMALVIGAPAFRVTPVEAATKIYGYACALDMTRRDLQQALRAKQRPWDLGKDFENAAIFGPITKADEMGEIGPQCIQLEVNGETRQYAHLSDLIHNVHEIVADLSKFYHLAPGDVILTGTPSGVGAVAKGDVLAGSIDGLDPVTLTIGAPE